MAQGIDEFVGLKRHVGRRRLQHAIDERVQRSRNNDLHARNIEDLAVGLREIYRAAEIPAIAAWATGKRIEIAEQCIDDRRLLQFQSRRSVVR